MVESNIIQGYDTLTLSYSRPDDLVWVLTYPYKVGIDICGALGPIVLQMNGGVGVYIQNIL